MLESVTVRAQIAGDTEVDVTLPRAARVRQVYVDVGQVVPAGAPLVDLEMLPSAAEAARGETAGEVEARQEQLRRVIAELDEVQGATPALRRLAAESGLLVALAQLRRLETEQPRATPTPRTAERRLAEQEVEAATQSLRRAEAEMARVRRGVDPSLIRRAESDAVTAETDVARAQAAYQQIVRGPDPVAIQLAERDLEQAEGTLKIAQAIRPVLLPTPTARPAGNGNREVRAEREARARVEQDANNQQLQQELAIRQAEQAVATARERLERAKRGPTRAEIDVAAREVEATKTRLAQSRERVQQLKAGPSSADMDTAYSAVTSAQVALARAEQRLQEVTTEAPVEQVTAPSDALDAARLAVRTAEARLLERVNSSGSARAAGGGAADEQVRAALEGPSGVALRAALAAASASDGIRAPSPPGQAVTGRLNSPQSGTVATVLVRTGDVVDAGRAIVSLMTNESWAVSTPLRAEDLDKVRTGLPVVADLPDQIAAAIGVVSEYTTQDALRAQFQLKWHTPPPPADQVFDVVVMLAERPDTLVAPAQAVYRTGETLYVNVFEGGQVKQVAVTIGLETPDEVEILSGVREGDVVLLQR